MPSPICILLTSNLKHSTLISHYTSVLNSKKIDYDIIFFDRYGIEEESEGKNVYKYTEVIDSNKGKSSKLPTFLRFRKYAIDILKKNNYQIVITWNTFTVFLFYTYLKRNKIPYIHNIRDYFNENNILIKSFQNKVSKNSVLNTISSEGFLDFLPNQKYLMVHSLNKDVDLRPDYTNKVKTGPIKIGFVGNVRFLEEQKRLIQLFKNDDRFLLYFCGTNAEKLEPFIVKNRISNVELRGAFKPSETKNIINEMTLINNIFGNQSQSVKTLTSIRLYHSTFLYKPILVNEDTFMSDIVEKNGLGFSLDLKDSSVKDQVYQWYNSLNYQEYKEKCNIFNGNIEKDNLNFKREFELILDKNI